MIKALLTSILTIVSIYGFSQGKTFSTVEETQEFSKEVSEKFMKGKVTSAFKQIKKYWPTNESEIDLLEEKTIKMISLVEPRFGKAIGTTKIKTETIADFAIRETYLVRYERHALRIITTYYKNDDGWIINSFKWDDSYSEEFK